MKQLSVFLLSLFMLLPLSAQETVSISGMWEYAMSDSATYADEVMLPGSLPISGRKVSFRRSVYVPGTWYKQRVFLYLERPLFATTVYVNGYKIGSDSTLSTPHRFDITKALKLGERNSIVVSGRSEGKVTGITGRMELRTHSEDIHIRRVRLFPLPSQGLVQAQVQLEGSHSDLSFYPLEVLVQREDVDSASLLAIDYEIDSRLMVLNVPVADKAALWDEFNPHRYRIGISAGNDYSETVFGMRELAFSGEQLMFNNRPLYLRGVVEEHSFEGGYLPTDERAWLDIFQKYKDCGLNLVCFRGCCPTEAAFAVADKLGLYLFTDKPQPELDLIADEFGHHPSFLRIIPPLSEIAYSTDVKAKVEQNLCSPDTEGFILKGFDDRVDATQLHQFCSALVPIAHFSKTEFTSADTLMVPVECYNALYGDIQSARVSYYITGDSLQVISGGKLYEGGMPIGKNNQLGSVIVPLNSIKVPQKLTLTIVFGGNKYANRWDFWVYPPKEE